MKRNESIKTAKRFYREIKTLVMLESTCNHIGRYLGKFKRHSLFTEMLRKRLHCKKSQAKNKRTTPLSIVKILFSTE